MSSLLVKRISEDLRINKFSVETDEEYGNRLIYSALIEWARVQVFGQSYTDISFDEKLEDLYYQHVDIMHIQTRLAQVSYGLLSSLEHSKKWRDGMEIDEASSRIASKLIDNMLFCNELSRITDSRRVTISPLREARFSKNYLILGEYTEFGNGNMSVVGMGRWVHASNLATSLVPLAQTNYKEIFGISNETPQKYLDSIINNATWKYSELKGQYQIFKIGEKGWYSKCWTDFNKSKLINGISLLKNIELSGGYVLVRKDEGEVYSTSLDKWYIDEREIYRIMYSLNNCNNSNAIFIAQDYDDFVDIHCNSLLPNAEMKVLLLSSWPKKCYNDIFHRIIPKFLWSEIEKMLNNLGVIVQFEKQV